MKYCHFLSQVLVLLGTQAALASVECSLNFDTRTTRQLTAFLPVQDLGGFDKIVDSSFSGGVASDAENIFRTQLLGTSNANERVFAMTGASLGNVFVPARIGSIPIRIVTEKVVKVDTKGWFGNHASEKHVFSIDTIYPLIVKPSREPALFVIVTLDEQNQIVSTDRKPLTEQLVFQNGIDFSDSSLSAPRGVFKIDCRET